MLVKENQGAKTSKGDGCTSSEYGGGVRLTQDSPVQHGTDSFYRKMFLPATENQCIIKKTHISTPVKLSSLLAKKLQGAIISELSQIDEMKEAVRIIGYSKLPGMGVSCGHGNLL